MSSPRAIRPGVLLDQRDLWLDAVGHVLTRWGRVDGMAADPQGDLSEYPSRDLLVGGAG